MSCGNAKNNCEEFYTLSLEVRNKATVYDSLRKQLDGEVIEDYKCDACNQSVKLQNRTLLGSMPNVLIVHLQRITQNFETWPFTNEKINSRLEFPPILDLNKYSFKANMAGKVNGVFPDEAL